VSDAIQRSDIIEGLVLFEDFATSRILVVEAQINEGTEWREWQDLARCGEEKRKQWQIVEHLKCPLKFSKMGPHYIGMERSR